MAANQVCSGTEASILPVRVPLAVQPTIFQIHQYILVPIQELDRLKRVYTASVTWKYRAPRVGLYNVENEIRAKLSGEAISLLK